jgi:hypothetical protein
MRNENIEGLIEHFIDAFDAQIQRIETVFDSSEAVSNSSSHLAEDFQYVLDNLREELTQANGLLRDRLARNGSVRKIDYDHLVDEIFVMLDTKEKEAKDSLYQYIKDQKTTVHLLRNGILSIRNSDDGRSTQHIENFKKELDQILKTQQVMKEFVMAKFQDFQQAHNSVIERFIKALENSDDEDFMNIKTIKKFLSKDDSFDNIMINVPANASGSSKGETNEYSR